MGFSCSACITDLFNLTRYIGKACIDLVAKEEISALRTDYDNIKEEVRGLGIDRCVPEDVVGYLLDLLKESFEYVEKGDFEEARTRLEAMYSPLHFHIGTIADMCQRGEKWE